MSVDYHVEVDHNYYSVPYQLARQDVDVRLTQGVVEVLFRGKRVASHKRLYGSGRYSTLKEHMPASHQRYLEWTPSRIVGWAKTIGPNTEKLVQQILESKPHPEQGFRSCLGIIHLSKAYPSERLEAACKKALFLGAYSYRSVKSILAKNLDQVCVEDSTAREGKLEHSNIRGAGYYAN